MQGRREYDWKAAMCTKLPRIEMREEKGGKVAGGDRSELPAKIDRRWEQGGVEKGGSPIHKAMYPNYVSFKIGSYSRFLPLIKLEIK